MRKYFSICLFFVMLFLLVQGCSNQQDNIIQPIGGKGANIRKAATVMNILVPAYFASSSTYWDTLTSESNIYNGMIYAIINVANGPGTALDPTLLSKITTFRNAQGQVLGYVNTWANGDTISTSTVKSDINKWYDWYGDQLDGIFFDQMNPYNGGRETYYQNLYNYVKHTDPQSIVIGNPGGNTSETYVNYNGNRLTDVICTFENTYSNILTWPFQSFQQSYTPDRFAFLCYATSSSQMQDAVKEAANRGYGWVYCTNDSLPNPWDTLPPYFRNECNVSNNIGYGGDQTTITVDGNASDWSGIAALATTTTSAQKLKVTNDNNNLYILIQGTGLNVTSDIYIDSDNNSLTGYDASGWAINGCDYLVENNIVYVHSGPGFTWTAVLTLSASQFVQNSTVIELSIPLSTLGISTSSTILLGYIKNGSSADRLPGANDAIPSKTLAQ